MQKPNDYDSVQEYSNFTPLEPGGYVCKIMQVKETAAKSSGAPMLEISLEIAEGKNKDYFAQQYKSDTRAEKKWGCVVYQLINDVNGGTNKGFKTFNTAAERSNNGFKIVWGDNYCNALKGKLIGGVFRREQYVANDGTLKFSTKCAWFRSVEEIRKGVDVPPDKLLDADNNTYSAPQGNYSQAAQNTQSAPQNNNSISPYLSDFEEVISGDDLPF